jgi:hypothetical protein
VKRKGCETEPALIVSRYCTVGTFAGPGGSSAIRTRRAPNFRRPRQPAERSASARRNLAALHCAKPTGSSPWRKPSRYESERVWSPRFRFRRLPRRSVCRKRNSRSVLRPKMSAERTWSAFAGRSVFDVRSARVQGCVGHLVPVLHLPDQPWLGLKERSFGCAIFR